ncbi:MAG: ATP-binding protein [Candidatus Omnitrophota bacterium]
MQKYIKRQIAEIIKKQIKHFPSLALCGPRQSGKSTLLKNIFGRTHSIISFDDPLTREKAINDPKLFIENAGEHIIFDEIQYVPQLLSYLKILIDQDRHRNGRFIITGSQQFQLIKNLGDSLAGRIVLFNLLPFSLEEKKSITLLKDKINDTRTSFIHACLRGSFPEIAIHKNIDPSNWYGSYIQTYLERDIRSVYNVRSLREFQQFLYLLAARTAQILNLSNFSNDLGISVNTIKKWLSILEASQLIYILPPYYSNLGKRITKSPKVYFLDTGLVCYLTTIKHKEQLFSGPMSGALFENFVVQEVVKLFFNRGVRPNLFYLRTPNNLEIDLIIEKNLEIFPFEIKLTKTPTINMAKAVDSFKKIFSKLNIKPGKIISLVDLDTPLTNSALAVNINSCLSDLDKLIQE